MKLERITVTNFLGAAAVDVRTREKVQLFCGPNAAGKSSLRDAIALALTGDLGRVSLKKESGQLVRAGADLAVCSITTVDGDEYKVSINSAGKVHDAGCKGNDPVWPYVLDAQRFARMDLTERRAFLYGLMDLKTDGAALIDRLKKRGLDEAKIGRIAPLLAHGFESACAEAKAKATAAKGAWRAVTGETYGSEKAKTWRAAVPPYDAKVATGLTTELQHCDVAVGGWQQTIGNLQAQERRREQLRARLPELQAKATRVEPLRTKLATDEETLADVAQRLETARAAAGTAPRVGYVHTLARLVYYCADAVDPEDIDAAQNALAAYEREHGPVNAAAGGDPDARARLPELQAAHDTATRTVANDKRDIDAALAAKGEADGIGEELKEVFDAAALQEAREKVEELTALRVSTLQKLENQKSIKALVDGAQAKTTGAAGHAADVAAWDAIGEALAPDGIPGEILAEALGPFNARLAQSAADAEWPLVELHADMRITAAGRDYRLCSESEQWRVDAMVAEAVAHISGSRLLVLDRFDVLDLKGRDDLLAWLDVLADAGEIDTAIVFGTLKALPAVRASTAAHWIEHGVVRQLAEAA